MTDRVDFTAYRLPALAVPCPDCLAPAGSNCKRPSEHEVFGGDFHKARGCEADRVFIAQHGERAAIKHTKKGWEILE